MVQQVSPVSEIAGVAKVRNSARMLAILLLVAVAILAALSIGLARINESPAWTPSVSLRMVTITAGALVIPAFVQAMVLFRVRARYPAKSGKTASLVVMTLTAIISIGGLVAAIVTTDNGTSVIVALFPLLLGLIISGIALLTAKIPSPGIPAPSALQPVVGSSAPRLDEQQH